MIEPHPHPAVIPAAVVRSLPWLLLLFFGSGCAALIYEIVWFQLLQLVIGSSAVSLGVLLGTFMGGMCLGSLALPRLIGSRRHPLRVYALLELGIGLIGIAILFCLPYLDELYAASATRGLMGMILRAGVAAVCLLPPTLLMGATLPAVARWVETTRHGVSWLGFFYGGNIAGAVIGCLLAGFYLLRVYDMVVATYVAAAINATVALSGLLISMITPHACPTDLGYTDPAEKPHRAWGLYLVIGLSGLTALGAEVIWTRLLSLMIGGTVYTFSIILAMFLIGLGLGSSVGSFLARGRNSRFWLGVCQLMLTTAIAWTAYQLTSSLPYWPINPSLSRSPWDRFQLDLLRCLWAIFPATCLWGASFPLALGAIAARGQDPGRLVGGVYAANTVGAITGALGFSILIIAWLGTQRAQQTLMVVAAASATVALAPLLTRSHGGGETPPQRSWARRLSGALGLGAGIGAAIWLTANVPETSGELIAYGRFLPTYAGTGEILYQGEGMNASVAVTLAEGNVRNFHVSGKVEASSDPQDMRLQRMLGHLPALVHPKPRRVLVVGCGAGVTAGSFVVNPDVERIVICEIEPLIPKVVAKYFVVENYNVVNDPKVAVVFDDARHFILTTTESFDVITSDPIHPWVKGAATLYTREYFELCKRRLNPGGVITQWVPLYESDEATVKSELATFFDVFPEGTVWSNDEEGAGYDLVLLGQVEPLHIDIDQLEGRLNRPDYQLVAQSLDAVGFGSGLDLLSKFGGTAADLKPWLADAEINKDRNLRLQYLAGLGSSYQRSEAIFDAMLKYRRFPQGIFVGSETSRNRLRHRVGLANKEP